MQRSLIGLLPRLAPAVVAAWLVAMPAVAGEVFQWKDANGVTHYSQTPPPKGSFKQRVISTSGQPQAPQAPQVAARDESTHCAMVRKNLDTLGSPGEVQLDIDGDGKPDRVLSAADRADQVALAQATLKANCGAVADAP
jgi:hypothetical protein